MITLNDERLKAIVSEIIPCEVIADIGSDHGYVIAYAVEHNLCKRAVATDISKGSLSKTISLIKSENLLNVSARLGNGAEVLEKDEYDTVIIAGMGGMEIIKILKNAVYPFNRYILSPQKNQYELRKFLSENKIKPLKDYKVRSGGKYYDVIVAERGEYSPDNFTLHYGYANGEYFDGFKTEEINRLKRYYVSSTDSAREKLAIKLSLLGAAPNESKGFDK